MYKSMVWKSYSISFANDLVGRFAFQSYWGRWMGSHRFSKTRIYHPSRAHIQIAWSWWGRNGIWMKIFYFVSHSKYLSSETDHWGRIRLVARTSTILGFIIPRKRDVGCSTNTTPASAASRYAYRKTSNIPFRSPCYLEWCSPPETKMENLWYYLFVTSFVYSGIQFWN